MHLTTLLFTVAVQAPTAVAVSPDSVHLAVDQTVQLTATVTGRGAGGIVRWFSEDRAVATVSGEGVVRGVRPGVVRILVTSGSASATATITVAELPAERVTVGRPAGRLYAGTSVPLTVDARNRLGTAAPSTGVRWETSNAAVAAVDATHRLHLRASGRARITARVGDAMGALDVEVGDAPLGLLAITPATPSVRTGDVVRFGIDAPEALYPAWSVSGAGATIEAEGSEGVFVAEAPGRYEVTAVIGESAVRTAVVDVAERRYQARLTAVGRGPISAHHSGDVWVFEGVDGRDYAYIGTFLHDWMKVWDVTDPAAPFLTDSIQLDARRINDVKIHPNDRIGILTREGASSRRNGIVILDLSTPAHPAILSEYTETVTGGVHNVWVEPNDMIYAAHNGTSDLHIIDISDPRNPREVGVWGLDKPGSLKTLHDVIVQDGYAYLSYWDDGIVMLDVGAGSHGGTPSSPVMVSRYAYPVGNTHTAWRAGRYLFVGDEIFPPGWDADRPIHTRGYIHVIDYNDPEHPREVARYEVPEAGAHNVWVEGDRLYVGYYQAGLRVVDISGELRGDLYRQGREIASILTTDENTTTPNWPMTWGAQIHKGHIFTSDLNSGLWVARLDETVLVP